METEQLLSTISTYLYIIPVLVGIVYWECLSKPIKIYWLWHGVCLIDIILVQIFTSQSVIRILDRALLNVGMAVVIGWFLIDLFQRRSEKIALSIVYAVFIGYDLYDFISSGTLHNARMLMLDCALTAILSFLLLRRLLPQSFGLFQTQLFIVLLALFVEHFLNVLLYGFFDAFERYLSSRWDAVIWYEISPVFNLVFVCVGTYALYLSGQNRRVLSKIPELESIK